MALHKFPAWGPVSSAPSTAAKTLADEAFARIRDDIITGNFAPGEKLQPDALRRRYTLGVSPLREALARLASDGLTVADGQRGFFAPPVCVGELQDVTKLRAEFSGRALALSVRYGDDAWESAVVAASYQLNKLTEPLENEPHELIDEWEARNRSFHSALESGCRSPWLIHFCEVLYDQSERYRRTLAAHRSPRAEIHDEHQRMMDAALKRDSGTACEILSAHIVRGGAAVQALMERAAVIPKIEERA
jgi:GntR family transcriptional regulator, carbon starvation induced regulator